MKYQSARSLFIALACSTAISTQVFAQAIKHIEVPAGDLTVALETLAQQSGAELVYQSDQLKGIRTQGVSGDISPQDAVKKLIAGTTLVLRTDKSGAMLITAQTSPQEPQQQGNAKKTEPEVPRSRPSQTAAADQAFQVPAASRSGDENNTTKTEEIVVTGTHIRGISDRTSPLMSFNRQTIDDSGYSTTQQFIESLPQNFAGGVSALSQEGLLSPSTGAQANISRASGVNLRGLGNTATLVLVNGHRMAPSAYGAGVDISLIPLEAVDHIDLLMDGSSAIYGSEAVGGVVNFVLRKDYSGTQTDARFGSVTNGSSHEVMLDQLGGYNWQTGSALLNIQARDSTALPTTQRAFTASAPQPTDILPHTTDYSGMFNAHQDASDRLTFYADGLYTNGHDISRYVVGAQQSRIKTTTNLFTFNGGTTYEIFGDWKLDASGTYSRENTRAFSFFSNPAIPGYTNGTLQIRNDFTIGSGELKADGTLWSLPGGNVKAALGGAIRAEDFSSIIPYLSRTRPFDRNVSAAFGELYVPIVGQANALSFVREFDISAAIRYDHYSDFGGTTNPKIGASLSPVADLLLRTSYSTSFRAPDASEEIAGGPTSNMIFIYRVPSPGGGTAPVFLLSGYQPLNPETSQNWNAGFDYTPSFVAGLKVGLDYYHVDFKNRIVTPGFQTNILLSPNIYGSLITQFTSDAQAQAFLTADMANAHSTLTDLVGTGIAGVRYAYNFRQQNAAFVTQDGFDIDSSYAFNWGASEFTAALNATVINKILTAFSATSTPTDVVNTYNNPLRLRLRGTLGWKLAAWQVNAALNYSGGYQDTLAIPVGSISPWATVDLTVRYTVPGDPGLSFQLSATNLFDQSPPYATGGGVITGIHYDSANASALGRFLAFEVRKKW